MNFNNLLKADLSFGNGFTWAKIRVHCPRQGCPPAVYKETCSYHRTSDACFSYTTKGQFSGQRAGHREPKDGYGRVDRYPAGKLILRSLIETLAYLLKYLRERLALDFSSSLVISTSLGFWVTSNYCLLPSSFPMIWGYQPLPRGEDFLHLRYLPITICRYWINSHLVNCPSVSMRVFLPANHAIILSGYEIIVHSL